VPNKKTIIIGGLLTNSEFENESKVPILGDIPILGYLFRSTSTQTSTNEVVFFISPRIIQGFRGERTDAPVGG
jgi:general secretion pathway protein D